MDSIAPYLGGDVELIYDPLPEEVVIPDGEVPLANNPHTGAEEDDSLALLGFGAALGLLMMECRQGVWKNVKRFIYRNRH